MQRQVYQLKAGSRSNIKLMTDELPDPEANEVTIAVKAIGLNFADIFAIWGLYSATPEGVFTPGLEYAGEVIKVGAEVKHIKEGDAVMGVTRFGAYTTHLNIDARYVSPLPSGWSFEEGAAYPVQVLTAYYALFNLGDLQKDQTVLIHSAAGGVGIWANRIAKTMNAYTIGSVGRSAKLDFLKQEGYDQGIVRSKHFKADLEQALSGKPLNLVMECIGGKIFQTGYDLLAPQGRMVVYGSARYASGGSRPNYLRLIWQYLTRPKIDPQKMIELNKAIMGFNLIWLYHQADLMREILQKLENMDIGKAHIGHRFEFDAMNDALALFQSGKTIGKVVVSP